MFRDREGVCWKPYLYFLFFHTFACVHMGMVVFVYLYYYYH